MTAADDLLRQGDLDGARKALVEVVRSSPADAEARMFLFQLLAVAGEWDKAKTQLATLAQLSAEAQMLSVAYGQAIEAEKVRAGVFAGTAEMPLLHHADWAVPLAKSFGHFARGDADRGDAARDEAFEAAPDMPGRFNDVAFDWIADADARFGPSFEAIVNGAYGLIPFDAVESIKSDGPRDLRDTVWFPVTLAFRTGTSIAALLPARYPGSEGAADTAERLGRATSWRASPAGEIGSGQHLLSLSSGDDHDLLSLRHLTFA